MQKGQRKSIFCVWFVYAVRTQNKWDISCVQYFFVSIFNRLTINLCILDLTDCWNECKSHFYEKHNNNEEKNRISYRACFFALSHWTNTISHFTALFAAPFRFTWEFYFFCFVFILIEYIVRLWWFRIETNKITNANICFLLNATVLSRKHSNHIVSCDSLSKLILERHLSRHAKKHKKKNRIHFKFICWLCTWKLTMQLHFEPRHFDD